MRPARGFTLVELLVALFALALLATLSWRGIDGMVRGQQETQRHADEVLTLQTGLAQWHADLEAIVEVQGLTALEWNGSVLRLTRRDTADVAAGVRVVGWTLREGRWRRWQSLPAATRGEVEAAWLQAARWVQTAEAPGRPQEVALVPLDAWELFYFRDGAWTPAQAGSPGGVPPNPAAPGAASAPALLPDGVRLVLQLAPQQALAGRVTRDWSRPTVGGGKS